MLALIRSSQKRTFILLMRIRSSLMLLSSHLQLECLLFTLWPLLFTMLSLVLGLQLSSLAIFFAGIYGWRIAVLDGLEMRFQVSSVHMRLSRRILMCATN